jgi:uncharacterized membrane protein
VSLEVAVVRFDGVETAVERYAAAMPRSSRGGPPRAQPQWTRDVGFVERHHSGHMLLRGTFAGHYLDVDEGDDVSQKGAGEGAAAGGIVGVLGGPPGIAVGLLLGGIVGSQVGSAKEAEDEPEALAARLRDAVPRGSSAIVLIAPAAEVDEMFAAFGDGEGAAVRRALTDEETTALEASLEAAPRTATGP